MNLFVEFFNHPNPIRNIEIKNTLKYNLSLKFLDNFYLFGLSEDLIYVDISDKKLQLIQTKDRCTFQNIIDYVNQLANNDINIVINNDILLSNNMCDMKLNDKTFYAISRWEVNNCINPWRHNRCDSQDIWVWKGRCDIKNANFYFGTTGCDGKLAYLAHQCGYEVINPAYTYKCLHNHLSCIRTSAIDPTMIVIPPYYKVCPNFI